MIGEAPGNQEIIKNEVFIGPSGKLMEQVLTEAGFVGGTRGALVMNAVMCRPENNGKITNEYIDNCRSRLLGELSEGPHKILLLLGNSALRSVTGNNSLKITQERGKAIETLYGLAVPTFHPAAILRNITQYSVLRDDVRYAISLLHGAQRRSPGEVSYEVADQTNIERLLMRLEDAPVLAVDIETTGLNPRRDAILCVGLAYAKNKAIIVPAALVSRLKPLFERSDVRFVWHNGKFDTAFLASVGITARIDGDTMLQSYALKETGSHKLKDIASDLIGASDWKDVIKQYIKHKDDSFSLVPNDVLYKYLAEDCDNTYQIHEVMEETLTKPQNQPPVWCYQNVLLPAVGFLREVERTGMLIDQEYLIELRQTLRDSVARSVEAMQEFYGEPFNPASIPQISNVLGSLSIDLPNTARATLETVGDHPFIKLLLDYRREVKALGTYVEGIAKRLESDGRIHSTYNVTTTANGRLSSSDPNLQNISAKADPDNRIKRLFIASPGYVLIECDYSQAELRMLAHLSGDEFLTQVYVDGRDLHSEVARALFGPDYTKIDRTRAKTVNFGVTYGQQAKALGEQLGIPQSKAQAMIRAWFKQSPKAHAYLTKQRQFVQTRGYVQSPFGRRRRFPMISGDTLVEAQNAAANHPISSAASDITLLSAIAMHPWLSGHGARIVNLVHDSIMIEAPETTAELIAGHAVSVMQETPTRLLNTQVPFVADCKIGWSWGNMHPLETSLVAVT